MLCPHCNLHVHFQMSRSAHFDLMTGSDETKEKSTIYGGECPSCGKPIVVRGVAYLEAWSSDGPEWGPHRRLEVLYPRFAATVQIPAEVPPEYEDDYREAVAVQQVSAKASAALSRRLLQHILRKHYSVKHGTLYDEMAEFAAAHTLPSFLSQSLDAIRKLGNIAAHPTEDYTSGGIVDVEPEEAEWLIELIDALFDFAFVQPAKESSRMKALEAKLQAAKKPRAT